jgi:hypothetical protein
VISYSASHIPSIYAYSRSFIYKRKIFQVSWMKGLTDITETHRTLKETINDYVRLTLKRALISDAGTYFIVAKNKHGTDRAFFTLRVSTIVIFGKETITCKTDAFLSVDIYILYF